MRNKVPLKFINFYQEKVSTKTNPKCKYYPTCSNYAKECFENYNFFYAFFLSIKRILKCNPFSKGGYDPIPKIKKQIKKENKSK